MEIIRDAEGGMKNHFLILVKGLASQGMDVVALCNLDETSIKDMEKSGVFVIPFRFSKTINPYSDSIAVFRLVSLIHKHKPDIVHCHGFKAGLLGRIACLATRVSMLYTVHNFVTFGRDRLSKWLIHCFESWMGNKTDAIICVSNALKKSMIEDMHLDENKITVIHNSISNWPPANGMLTRKRYNIENDYILIGTVSRLVPSKGIDILLRAVPEIFSENPFARLMIVGTCPEESRLKRLAVELEIDSKVIFTGEVSDIQDYYSAFDIFVLPTLSEGLGITILEAMSFGLPVLASAAGGIPELIVHERNGILVKPGNVIELRNALQYILNNPVKAEQYGCQAKADINNGLTNYKMINETI